MSKAAKVCFHKTLLRVYLPDYIIIFFFLIFFLKCLPHYSEVIFRTKTNHTGIFDNIFFIPFHFVLVKRYKISIITHVIIIILFPFPDEVNDVIQRGFFNSNIVFYFFTGCSLIFHSYATEYLEVDCHTRKFKSSLQSSFTAKFILFLPKLDCYRLSVLLSGIVLLKVMRQYAIRKWRIHI